MLKLLQIIKAIDAETRLQILMLLKEHPLCGGALSARLNVSESAVSQHLRILKDAGLVIAERRGYYVHYCINGEMVNDFLVQLKKALVADNIGAACKNCQGKKE